MNVWDAGEAHQMVGSMRGGRRGSLPGERVGCAGAPWPVGDNLPVTRGSRGAVSGYKKRPTFLSNRLRPSPIWGIWPGLGPNGYAAQGTAAEAGTTLLTLRGTAGIR